MDKKIAKLERRIKSLERDLTKLREIVKRALARERIRTLSELDDVRKEIKRERKRERRKSAHLP